MALPLLIVGALASLFLGYQALQAASVIIHVLALVGGIGAGFSLLLALERERYLTSSFDLELSNTVEILAYILISVPVAFLSWKFIESLIAGASLTVALIAVLLVVAFPYIGVSGITSIVNWFIQLIVVLRNVLEER